MQTGKAQTLAEALDEADAQEAARCAADAARGGWGPSLRGTAPPGAEELQRRGPIRAPRILPGSRAFQETMAYHHELYALEAAAAETPPVEGDELRDR